LKSCIAARVGRGRVSRRRQRARSAPQPAAQRLRHRHVGASLPGQEALPELLDHRQALRLAHVRFGLKTIEVATVPQEHPGRIESEPAEPPSTRARSIRRRPRRRSAAHRSTARQHVRHAEEDAFRRDFTINALFYDIATFSIIDYVGGLQDLKDG
jgi:tRNA nucleotidyltransferase/poly(A) polymerase